MSSHMTSLGHSELIVSLSRGLELNFVKNRIKNSYKNTFLDGSSHEDVRLQNDMSAID